MIESGVIKLENQVNLMPLFIKSYAWNPPPPFPPFDGLLSTVCRTFLDNILLNIRMKASVLLCMVK